MTRPQTVRVRERARAAVIARLRALGGDLRCACDGCGAFGEAFYLPGAGAWAYCPECVARYGYARAVLSGGYVIEAAHGGAR